MVAARLHLDLDAVYVNRFLVVQILIHEKFALEIGRHIERPDVQLDAAVRLGQGRERRRRVALEVGQGGDLGHGAVLRRALENPLQDELEFAVGQRIHAQRHQRTVAGVVVVKMLPLGGVDFLPQKTFADACQPLGADEFQPVVERVGVGRLAVDELPVGGIRRENEIRLLRKRRALAVATGAVRAKDTVAYDAPRRGAALVTHTVKAALRRPAPVLKHRLFVGGLQQLDVVPLLQVGGAFHVKTVTEKLGEIVHRRAVDAELKLPRLAKPLRLQRKLQSAAVVTLSMLAMRRPHPGRSGHNHHSQQPNCSHHIQKATYTRRLGKVTRSRPFRRGTILHPPCGWSGRLQNPAAPAAATDPRSARWPAPPATASSPRGNRSGTSRR